METLKHKVIGTSGAGPEQLLIHVQPEPDAATVAAMSSNLAVDLRGTIEILFDSTYLKMGYFLFLDMDAIARGLLQLREGATRASIDLLDSPALFFSRTRREPALIEVHARKETLHRVPILQLDQAFGAAFETFFAWLAEQRRGAPIDREAADYAEVVASVWPGIEPLFLLLSRPRPPMPGSHRRRA